MITEDLARAIWSENPFGLCECGHNPDAGLALRGRILDRSVTAITRTPADEFVQDLGGPYLDAAGIGEVPIAENWTALLANIEIIHLRHALHRLASFCSHMQIAPTAVTQETLVGLYEALKAEEIVKDPRQLAKSTANAWCRCSRETEGWPAVQLEALFRTTP